MCAHDMRDFIDHLKRYDWMPFLATLVTCMTDQTPLHKISSLSTIQWLYKVNSGSQLECEFSPDEFQDFMEDWDRKLAASSCWITGPKGHSFNCQQH